MKKEQLVIIGILGALGLSYLIFVFIPGRELEKNHLYTIATITKFESQSEGSKEAKISYEYKNRNYQGSFPITMGYENKFEVGGRVYINFSPLNPDNAKVEYDIIVPETFKNNDTIIKELPN